MPKTTLCSAAVAVALLACSPSHADASGAPDFQWRKAIASPTRLEVHDMNGSIRAEPSNGDALEIVAIKSGKREDFARVDVVVREEGGAVRACALWPGQTSCEGETKSGRDHVDVRVDFVLRVPAKVSSLTVRTMNGSIDATASGPLEAHTMNGSVVGRVAGPTTRVRLGTMNGRVEVVLPANAGADVEAKTMRGRISSAFGAVPPPPFPGVPNETRFRVGTGGGSVALETMNGDVVVSRGG